MGKRKYKVVVAAVLAGVVLFSPLLCGMSCLEGRGVQPVEAMEMVAPVAGEFAGEFVESGVVGCVVMNLVWRIDASEWGSVLRVGEWIWIEFEAVELVSGINSELVDWVGGV